MTRGMTQGHDSMAVQVSEEMAYYKGVIYSAIKTACEESLQMQDKTSQFSFLLCLYQCPVTHLLGCNLKVRICMQSYCVFPPFRCIWFVIYFNYIQVSVYVFM